MKTTHTQYEDEKSTSKAYDGGAGGHLEIKTRKVVREKKIFLVTTSGKCYLKCFGVRMNASNVFCDFVR